MDFESKKWNQEVLGKTFIPDSVEQKIVEKALERIGQVLDVSGKEETLRGILTVGVLDAYEITVKRIPK